MKQFESIKDIVIFLRQRGEKLKPLSLNQIKNIEEKFNINLPQIYRDFLTSMGKGAGSFMEGSSVFYDELFSLHQWTRELIAEHYLNPLPESAFVFWMHQGYQAAFFKTTDGDNPPVYFYSEGKNMKEFVLEDATLIDFFVRQLSYSYPEFK